MTTYTESAQTLYFATEALARLAQDRTLSPMERDYIAETMKRLNVIELSLSLKGGHP